jgi:hypothetical protein
MGPSLPITFYAPFTRAPRVPLLVELLLVFFPSFPVLFFMLLVIFSRSCSVYSCPLLRDSRDFPPLLRVAVPRAPLWWVRWGGREADLLWSREEPEGSCLRKAYACIVISYMTWLGACCLEKLSRLKDEVWCCASTSLRVLSLLGTGLKPCTEVMILHGWSLEIGLFVKSFSSNEVRRFSIPVFKATALPLWVVLVMLATEDRFLDWLLLKGVVLREE